MKLWIGSVVLLMSVVVACGRTTRDAERDPPESCDSADPCVWSVLDPATNRCRSDVKTGASCDDGDPCTEADTCDDVGRCGGEARRCDDGLDCTIDTCAPGLGCQHATDPSACDDANPCTRDSCRAGRCEHYPDSGNTCGESGCLARAVCRQGECVEEPVDTAGICYPRAVDFGDVIVGMTAVRSILVDAAPGAIVLRDAVAVHPELELTSPEWPQALDRGEALTIPLRWSPADEGSLDTRVLLLTEDLTWYVPVTGRALPQPDCDDGVSCTDDRFDAETGQCSNPTTPDASCEDGDPCTVDDRCDEAATCRPGGPRVCPPGEVCKEGACQPRLCESAEQLTRVCAEVAAPQGEGCLCELVHRLSSADVQARIDALLTRPEHAQPLLVSALLAGLLAESSELQSFVYTRPQLTHAAAANQAIDAWDLDRAFVLPGTGVAVTTLDETADASNHLSAYEALAAEPNLGTLTARLLDAGFRGGRNEHRAIGLAGHSDRTLRRVLRASPAESSAIVDELHAAFENEETGLYDLFFVGWGR